MEKFTFNVEQKSTIWESGWVDIEAETYEEAKEKVIALFEKNLDGRYIDDLVEPDLQTLESMDPSQNGGRPTRFLCSAETDDILWDNRPSTPEPPQLPEEFQEMAKLVDEFDDSTKQFLEAVKAAGGTIVGCGKA